jgi:hypothetical protein
MVELENNNNTREEQKQHLESIVFVLPKGYSLDRRGSGNSPKFTSIRKALNLKESEKFDDR